MRGSSVPCSHDGYAQTTTDAHAIDSGQIIIETRSPSSPAGPYFW